MKNYQIVLPLLALAFAMTFVEKTAALSIRPGPCPPKQMLGCNPCGMPHCSHIANPPNVICLECMVEGCICKSGYYWQDDDCVPASKCRVTCPENMVYQACSRKLPTCPSPKSKPIVPEETCRPRCVCKPGYILAEEGSQKCIPRRECKQPGHY
ncbi:uncharacterized protein ACMZJ9_018735 isoform 1-T1 [Mantella aurantiaca]